MALPEDYDKVRISGRYVYLNGELARGQVRFTGKTVAVSADSSTIIVPNTIIAVLEDGQFSVDLPATDDPDIQPNGWTYTVVENLSNGGGRTYEIDVPLSAAAEGIDLSRVAPVTPASGDPTAFVTLTKFIELEERLSGVEPIFSKTWLATNPETGTYVVWRAVRECSLTAVRAYRTGGTGATVNATADGSSVLPVNLTLSTADTWISSSLSDSIPIAEGTTIAVSVHSLSGSVSSLAIQLEFRSPSP